MTGDWKLALEQTGDMEVVQGSLEETGAHVARGADLRLFLVARGYEETLYFQQTYAGQNGEFAGLMTHHHSHAHRGQQLEQPYVSFFNYDALGAFSHVKWMWGNQVYYEPQPYQYGLYKWYVCDRWRVVYEHDEEGRMLTGDLEELKELIRQGCSLKVGVRNLFGLPSTPDEGLQHVSFLSVMQPLIEEGHAGANCDFVLSGAPQWPIRWQDGLSLGMVWPRSSGELIAHWVVPGELPFGRQTVRRGMQWLVAERA